VIAPPITTTLAGFATTITFEADDVLAVTIPALYIHDVKRYASSNK
jgi:hypothetical protein